MAQQSLGARTEALQGSSQHAPGGGRVVNNGRHGYTELRGGVATEDATDTAIWDEPTNVVATTTRMDTAVATTTVATTTAMCQPTTTVQHFMAGPTIPGLRQWFTPGDVGGAPWYGYYGYYFNPYPVLAATAALWMTDYVISQNLRASV